MIGWDPIAFLLAFVIVFALVYFLSRLLFSKKERVSEAFFSGNEVPSGTRVRASSLYWGFTHALKPYYDIIVPWHTGNVNDYVAWLVIVTALILLGVAF